jgi:hypothetical protein
MIAAPEPESISTNNTTLAPSLIACSACRQTGSVERLLEEPTIVVLPPIRCRRIRQQHPNRAGDVGTCGCCSRGGLVNGVVATAGCRHHGECQQQRDPREASTVPSST